jgi:hypothetical protein
MHNNNNNSNLNDKHQSNQNENFQNKSHKHLSFLLSLRNHSRQINPQAQTQHHTRRSDSLASCEFAGLKLLILFAFCMRIEYFHSIEISLPCKNLKCPLCHSDYFSILHCPNFEGKFNRYRSLNRNCSFLKKLHSDTVLSLLPLMEGEFFCYVSVTKFLRFGFRAQVLFHVKKEISLDICCCMH